jgi:hypothetical protein
LIQKIVFLISRSLPQERREKKVLNSNDRKKILLINTDFDNKKNIDFNVIELHSMKKISLGMFFGIPIA